MKRVMPKFKKPHEVLRKEIDLDKYDFSNAQAHLVASVNGRFNGADVNKFG